MHPWVVKNLIYLPIQAIRGERVSRYMAEIRAFHTEPYHQKQELQWNKLLELLNYVYGSNGYYRELFDKHGVSVKRIRDPSDFRRIPFLTKRAIRARSNEMVSSYRGRVSGRKTSGSTGVPLVFVKDRDSTAYMDALMYELYGWHGIALGDRQSRVWGIPLDLKGRMLTRLKDMLLNRVRLVSFDISEKSCRRYFRRLRRFRPAFMYGLVNTIVAFADTIRGLGLDPAELDLKAVITTGEILFPRSRQLLQTAFRCPIVNEYGTTENGIIAFECARGSMHLQMHNTYIEILRPDDGSPSTPGEMGEVVLTELHSRAMPFIRYRVGDLMKLSSDACGCGLEMPVVEEVLGRESDLIVTPDGKSISSAILSYSMPGGVLRFRSFQRAIDKLDIYVQMMDSSSCDDLSLIERKLRNYLGEDMRVTVNAVDELAVDETGKFRHFVSELGGSNRDGSPGL
jgi:phenylacetate-CoA ligase